MFAIVSLGIASCTAKVRVSVGGNNPKVWTKGTVSNLRVTAATFYYLVQHRSHDVGSDAWDSAGFGPKILAHSCL